MAEDRAHDPKRRFVYPGGSNKFTYASHEKRAQEYFVAHGSNKGVNKDMDTRAAMEQAYEATAPTNNDSRKKTIENIANAGNTTDHQQKQIKGK